jgi:hypothetical protein
VCALNFHVGGKVRLEAKFRSLSTGPRRSGRGRPQLDAGKVALQALARWEGIAPGNEHTVLSQAVGHQSQCQRPFHVVVAVALRTPRPAVLCRTDTTLPARTLYRYDQARVHIEWLFRDAKQ